MAVELCVRPVTVSSAAEGARCGTGTGGTSGEGRGPYAARRERMCMVGSRARGAGA